MNQDAKTPVILSSHTNRGYNLLSFRDRYDEECTLQESSLATEDAIWLGISEPSAKVPASLAESLGVDAGGQRTGWVDYPLPPEALLNARMHLTREHVRALLPHLIRFARSGFLALALLALSTACSQRPVDAVPFVRCESSLGGSCINNATPEDLDELRRVSRAMDDRGALFGLSFDFEPGCAWAVDVEAGAFSGSRAGLIEALELLAPGCWDVAPEAGGSC